MTRTPGRLRSKLARDKNWTVVDTKFYDNTGREILSPLGQGNLMQFSAQEYTGDYILSEPIPQSSK
jgi:hypothetical protein